MGALADLLKSERGLFGLALVIAATVLTALGVLYVDDWAEYTKWIFGFYVGGKTATSIAFQMSKPNGSSATSGSSGEEP